MRFSINDKLSFLDSFQFPSPSLDSVIKKLNKYDFNYLRQELDNNILDLVKEDRFYLYEYMSDFEKFKEESPSKERFYRSLTAKIYLWQKNWSCFSSFEQICNESDKRLSRFVFKMWRFIISRYIWKI